MPLYPPAGSGGSLDINGLTGADPAVGDEVPVYDISATANRKVLVGEILGMMRGHIDGLTLSNDAGDPTNDVAIAAGCAVDTTAVKLLVLAAAITKRLDAAWAVGTGNGGLDGTESVGGTPDVSTWYHVWLIMRSDTGVVDVLFSESATAPTMPTNYDYKRRIGAVRNNASGDILAFLQTGDRFMFTTVPALDVDATNSTTRANATIMVPTGVRVVAIGNFVQTASDRYTYVSTPDMTDQTPSATATPLFNAGATGAVIGGQIEVLTNTSAQIAFDCSTTTGSFRWATLGWRDFRGKDGL